MAKIFGIEGGSQVPSLSQAIAPTLDIPVMNFDSIESALTSFSTQEEANIANAEENFNSLTEFQDQLIGEKFDNEKQKDVFEKARKEIGIGDDAFRVSMSDLKDNYTMRGIRSKVGQIYERRDVQDIFNEQLRGKDYLDQIYKLKDMNPSLYKKALTEYNRYRNGEVSGFDLLPQQFQPIDVTSAIADSLKLIPQIDMSSMETKHGYAYEQIVKERSRDAINSVIGRLNNNVAFKNNLEAMFTDNTGKYNQQAANAYIEQIASEYAKQHIDIENVKEISTTKPENQPLQNVLDDVARFGGDVNELMKNKTVLQQAVKEGRIVKVDEDDTGVTVHYLDPNDEPGTVRVPKTGITGPVTYNMSINGETKQVTSQDVEDYKDTTPKVPASSAWGGWDKLSVNDGNPTKGYFKDGNFYTNDVKMLESLGLIPKGSDYEHLSQYGIKSVKQPDQSILFSIPSTSDKAVTEFPEVYAPNAKELDAKLDSSDYIANLPKDGEEYNIAKMFLASPKIQEGYFKNVFMEQDFKTYMDKIVGEDGAAPIKDNGKHDLSGVHATLKPLLETNTKEKLKYLAYHHANTSGGFLRDGSADIEGNPDADQQLKDQWVKIDSIMKDNPGLEFSQLIKKLESTNSYDAVNPTSSALGMYQITLGNHYDNIKEYIKTHLDDVEKLDQAAAPETTTAPEAAQETPADTTTTDNPFTQDFAPQDSTVQDTTKKKVDNSSGNFDKAAFEKDVSKMQESLDNYENSMPKNIWKAADLGTLTPEERDMMDERNRRLSIIQKQEEPKPGATFPLKNPIKDNTIKVGENIMSFVDKYHSGKIIDEVSKTDKEAAKNPLVFASKYLGVNEKNPQQQETIKGFLNSALPNFIKDKGEVAKDTAAWCAAFVNNVLNEGNFKGVDNKDAASKLRARTYATVGDPVSGLAKAKPGDIVVVKNKKNGSYHVAFYAGEKNGQYYMLGGNQNDEVNISMINPDSVQIEAVRRVNNMEDVGTDELNEILSTKYYNKAQTTTTR